MIVTIHCDTLGQAQLYQSRLSIVYKTVKLLRAPKIGDSGTYVWRVSPKEIA